jgi:hypothetical protein
MVDKKIMALSHVIMEVILNESYSGDVVRIKANLRNSHFGALDQRPMPITGLANAFLALRHVLRPTIPKGTHYALLLLVGWGARVLFRNKIFRYPMMPITIGF